MVWLMLAGVLRLISHGPRGMVQFAESMIGVWKCRRERRRMEGPSTMIGQRNRGKGDRTGRLAVRPGKPERNGGLGLQRVNLGKDCDGLLYVPPNYHPGTPAPFMLSLHGAGGQAIAALGPMITFADESGLILLAPDSRGQTWDRVRDGFGEDVDFIERGLAQLFEAFEIDQSRLAIEGFSDGASYALSLGITNGDLFTHIIAFSPGFAAPGTPEGKPNIFISHGTHDTVLPISSCSRRLVPMLRQAGYDVVYQEFDGGHDIPPDIAREAMDWFLGAQPASNAA